MSRGKKMKGAQDAAADDELSERSRLEAKQGHLLLPIWRRRKTIFSSCAIKSCASAFQLLL